MQVYKKEHLLYNQSKAYKIVKNKLKNKIWLILKVNAFLIEKKTSHIFIFFITMRSIFLKITCAIKNRP